MQIWKSATIALAVKTAFALKPKVAVCGAGISGSFAAYTLDHSGLFDVSVYEVGRGAGGRTSTRRQDEYVFDHGAQSIRGVHTTEFKDILTHWEIDKVIEEWIPERMKWHKKSLVPEPHDVDTTMSHYVGVPAMNSMSKYLLSPERIKKEFQYQAAVKHTGGRSWTVDRLSHEVSETEDLRRYDYIVLADRNAVRNDRKDFADPSTMDVIGNFVDTLRKNVDSSPVLIAMVVLAAPLPADAGDVITFDHDPILAMATRDSSKPQRKRPDGKECWVLQSTTEHAQSIIKSVGSQSAKERVAARAADDLSFAFSRHLLEIKSLGLTSPLHFIYAKGHRWSAGFPNVLRPLLRIVDGKEELSRSYFDESIHFGACGDYFEFPGSIEGAVLSGKSLADKMISHQIKVNKALYEK